MVNKLIMHAQNCRFMKLSVKMLTCCVVVGVSPESWFSNCNQYPWNVAKLAEHIMASILFSVAFLISDIKSPLLNSLNRLGNNPEYDGVLVLDGFKYLGLFLGVMLITIAIVIVISIRLFTYMTKNINEFEELKKNNIAVAILTAVIVISISLLVKESLYLLLETFVPYPEVPRIF